MKRLLTLIALLLMFSAFAAAQATQVPVCNGFNATGVPIDTASGSTVCTDYFGVANWANSPLPAGTITGYTLISPGSGYVNPQVVISDITGSGATATAAFDVTGAITGITGGPFPNYTMPMVTIVDVGAGGAIGSPTCGGVAQPVCGSGAMATAIISAPFTAGTGMLKFQDALPDLKSAIATPDINTFTGSDFYVIGLVQYQTKDALEPAADNSARVLPTRQCHEYHVQRSVISWTRHSGTEESASACPVQKLAAYWRRRQPVYPDGLDLHGSRSKSPEPRHAAPARRRDSVDQRWHAAPVDGP